jgi:hypothetical protein
MEGMMIVYSNWKLPVYQVIGPVNRVHWDYSHSFSEETEEDVWTAQEAVVPLDADRETFVRIVDAEGGDGEGLADGWFK